MTIITKPKGYTIMDTITLQLRDIAFAIRDRLEDQELSTWPQDEHGDLYEAPAAALVTHIDASDASVGLLTINVLERALEAEYAFTVRITGRRL